MLSSKSFLVLGCILVVTAVIWKSLTLVNPMLAAVKLKSSSLLILANTSFILAVLRRK
jgi:hypothetical protein